MILQEGRYYRARNGIIYGPIQLTHKPFWPFGFEGICDWGEDVRLTWHRDGTFHPHSHACSQDLIEEVYVGNHAIPNVASSDATPKVDRAVLASKILPRLAPDLTPPMAARQALQYADAFLKEISNGNDQG